MQPCRISGSRPIQINAYKLKSTDLMGLLQALPVLTLCADLETLTIILKEVV